MTKAFWLLLLATIGLLSAARPVLAEDVRSPIALPPAIKQEFGQDMRRHLGHLDDIVRALAAGDFQGAARIADLHLDAGHTRWAAVAEEGMSEEEIAAMKERLRALGMEQALGTVVGPDTSVGHAAVSAAPLAPSLDDFAPGAFRAMAAAFDQAAKRFAEVARGVGNPPSAADYQTVLAELSSVTAMCQSCHTGYRVE